MPYREKHSVKNHSIEELKAKGYFETKKLPNGSQKDSMIEIEETTSEGSLIYPPKENISPSPEAFAQMASINKYSEFSMMLHSVQKEDI